MPGSWVSDVTSGNHWKCIKWFLGGMMHKVNLLFLLIIISMSSKFWMFLACFQGVRARMVDRDFSPKVLHFLLVFLLLFLMFVNHVHLGLENLLNICGFVWDKLLENQGKILACLICKIQFLLVKAFLVGKVRWSVERMAMLCLPPLYFGLPRPKVCPCSMFVCAFL